MELHDELERARAEASVVRVIRGDFEPEGELGYVVGLAPDLLLLLRISNQITFDGFAVLRLEDITELEAPHHHADFVDEALRLRGESVAKAPPVELEQLESAVRSAGKLFSILALHREEAEPDVCQVGAVVRVSSDAVELLEIDPDAEWDDEPAEYSLSEITRIEFGGGYEEALALVGGAPPTVRHLRPVP